MELEDEIANKDQVTVRLPRSYIASLLGAIELGRYLEYWCDLLTQIPTNTSETDSLWWAHKVIYCIDEIKKQSAVQEDDRCWGQSDSLISIIAGLVNTTCDEFINQEKKLVDKEIEEMDIGEFAEKEYRQAVIGLTQIGILKKRC